MTLAPPGPTLAERLLLDFAYALESRMLRARLSRRDLVAARRAVVWHFSTDDHLRVLLEDLLAAGVATTVRCADASAPDRIRDASWFAPLGDTGLLSLERIDAKAAPDAPRPELSLLLVSDRAPRSRMMVARALADGASRKAIVNGRSEIWRGDPSSLARRALLSPMLRRLLPWRDRREARAIEAAWDRAEAAANAGDAAADHLLLARPVPIMLAAGSGDVYKVAADFDAASSALYGDEYYATTYPVDYPDWRGELANYQAHFDRNLRAVGLDPADFSATRPRVLDVGCGTGALVGLFRDAGADAAGIDPSPDAINKARAAFPNANFEAETLAERVERMEIDGEFDLLLLAHVVEHVEDAEALLASARRALRRGGSLYVETPLASREALRLRPAWHRQRDHCREYSERGLHRLVERAGFVVEGYANGLGNEPPMPHHFLLAR